MNEKREELRGMRQEMRIAIAMINAAKPLREMTPRTQDSQSQLLNWP